MQLCSEQFDKLNSFLSLLATWIALGLSKQTDSEQTDFAFDGEMTATEVCTLLGKMLVINCGKSSAAKAQKFQCDFYVPNVVV